MMKFKDLKIGDENKDLFVLVSAMEQKETRDKKPFIDFILEDGIEQLSAKYWNKKMDELGGIAIGDIIKIRTSVNKYQDSKQLYITNCRPIKEGDNCNEDELIKKAPINAKQMWDFIIDLVNSFENKWLKSIVEEVLKKHSEKLGYYPGGKVVHHAIKSGLLYHIYRMLLLALDLIKVYGIKVDQDGVESPCINKEILFAGIILHDIGKLKELDANINGKTSDFTMEGKMIGHIGEGIKELAIVCNQLNVPREIEVVLEHMIASHHGLIEYGSFQKPMTIEAMILSQLDMIDSQIYIFDEINSSTSSGTFSEKNFFLGTQVYNTTDL